MRSQLDTEFTELSLNNRRLISLALVVPGGPEFYIELTDCFAVEECSQFVLDTVLPKLNPSLYGRTTEVAREQLRLFLNGLGRAQIVCDAPDWDWPMLEWLAGKGGIPYGVVSRPVSVSVIDPLSEMPEMPHHALMDARILARFCEPKVFGVNPVPTEGELWKLVVASVGEDRRGA